jgi:rhomboid protease GluP
MAARVCPHCRELNSETETRCFRCGRRLPGPVQEGVTKAIRDVLGSEAPATRVLLFLNLAVFALCVLVDRRMPLGIGDGFRGSTLIRFGALGGELGEEEPYRLLAAVFVHAGLLHIGMNMLMFVDLGRKLEVELGSARFVLMFLGSGVLGFVASEIWYAPFRPLTVGASGGVFGQIGAVVGILYARRDPEWRNALIRYLIYAVILALIFNVNTAAHLGGFAAGMLLGYGFQKERSRYGFTRVLSVLAVLGIVSSAASVALSTRSPHWIAFRSYELRHE